MSNELEIKTQQPSIYSSIESFENGQRIAESLCSSNLVPQAYQGNVANTMVALEMATRIGISPFMVMQNLDIIKGKPSWSSTFIIAALNSCGRFKPIRFKFQGDAATDAYGCRAVTIDKKTGEKLIGPAVTWAMVKAEGWLDKGGSKWKTMPELMFQYRAAAFFGRLYAPDILKGMHSAEEVLDIQPKTIKDDLETLTDLFKQKAHLLEMEDAERIQEIIDTKEAASYTKVINKLKEI